MLVRSLPAVFRHSIQRWAVRKRRFFKETESQRLRAGACGGWDTGRIGIDGQLVSPPLPLENMKRGLIAWSAVSQYKPMI
ncbi:unnamed protein product, partial [Iphiclides podalirius]